MTGARLALIVANDEYDHPGLRRLDAPAQDAAALAQVLGDPGVGGFEVKVMRNRSTQKIRTAIERFFVDCKRDDLLLLHFSCHGLKDAAGDLFLAMKNTRPDLLASTGLDADFVNRMMVSSRAKGIVLFLDCCYGGAFPKGVQVRAAGEAQVLDAFAGQATVAGGRGRVVVSASNAMQYSFEAGELSDGTASPSVFTGALVEALTSGAADKDGDGRIGINELFSFVEEKVLENSPNQHPQISIYGAQGDIFLARTRIRDVKPTPLEPHLLEAMANPRWESRIGYVDLFRERAAGNDLGVALTAHNVLMALREDDSRRLSEAASAALTETELTVYPPSLELELDEAGVAPGILTLSGPPIAMMVTARTDDPWLGFEYVDSRLLVRVIEPLPTGTSVGAVTLKSPIGEFVVIVRATTTAGVHEQPPPLHEQVAADWDAAIAESKDTVEPEFDFEAAVRAPSQEVPTAAVEIDPNPSKPEANSHATESERARIDPAARAAAIKELQKKPSIDRSWGHPKRRTVMVAQIALGAVALLAMILGNYLVGGDAGSKRTGRSGGGGDSARCGGRGCPQCCLSRYRIGLLGLRRCRGRHLSRWIWTVLLFFTVSSGSVHCSQRLPGPENG